MLYLIPFKSLLPFVVKKEKKKKKKRVYYHSKSLIYAQYTLCPKHY